MSARRTRPLWWGLALLTLAVCGWAVWVMVLSRPKPTELYPLAGATVNAGTPGIQGMLAGCLSEAEAQFGPMLDWPDGREGRVNRYRDEQGNIVWKARAVIAPGAGGSVNRRLECRVNEEGVQAVAAW